MRRQTPTPQAGRFFMLSDPLLNLALNAGQVGIWVLDLNTGITNRTLGHDRCFGYDTLLPEWTLPIFLRHVLPLDRDRVDHAFQEAIASSRLYEVEFRVQWTDGSLHWLLSRANISHDTNGKPVSVSGALIDITAQKLAQEKMAHLSMIVDRVTTPIITTDNAGNINWVNNAFLDMTGYSMMEAMGHNPGRLLQGVDSCPITMQIMRQARLNRIGFEVDILNYRKDGRPFWQHIKADPMSDDGASGTRYIAVQLDITERKRHEFELWNNANFDALTSLPNRRLFWDRLNNGLLHGRRTGTVVALLCIDMDRFKEINDLYGHECGDAVLQEVAVRINKCLHESDTAARLGGDEFAVILNDLANVLTVDLVARKLLHALSQLIQIKDGQFMLSASIGLALFPADATNSEQLFRNADQAMYLAKNSGRNRLAYFTPSLQSRSERRLRIGSELRQAMVRDQLRVYFQPIVDLTTNSIVKAEALLRWSHPALGSVNPAEFIPIAEDLGLIDEIGDWVFGEAVRWADTWSTLCNRTIQVSVNKSASEFLTRQHGSSWPQLLHDWHMQGSLVSVEITEGVLLKDSVKVMATLAEYRAAGIEVALDDFGTGYSSIAYLKKFHIDYLKIDQSFVHDIDTEQSLVLVEAIIVMGHKLGLKIIAEGIETERQLQILVGAGCDFGQGYLFSHAIRPEEFGALLGHPALHSH